MGDRAATAMASDGEVFMSSVDMMKAVRFQALIAISQNLCLIFFWHK